MRNLKSSNTPTGTTVWNSFRKGIDNFNRQLYRIPGNGKRILLWDDNILGKTPLSPVFLLEEIKKWTINISLLRLVDICSWDIDGNWVDSSFPDILDLLISQIFLLISSLLGLAPVHSSYKHKRGWGRTRIYTAAQGFFESHKPHKRIVFLLRSGN